jgi:hypothetical protein
MGYLEASVVVYLRQIFYPQGFSFPLNPYMPHWLILVELGREFSTLVMLAAMGIITGKNFPQRVAYFLYSFGVWDIAYYASLKLTLGWPPSLLTWDILFLIPIIWVGPILAPIIASITMILLSIGIIYLEKRQGFTPKGGPIGWSLAGLGAFAIFISFIWDYSALIIKNNLLPKFFNLAANSLFKSLVAEYVPTHYCWWLFILGEMLIGIAFFKVYSRYRRPC